MADSVLTAFIERTRADPALARDLLDGTNWDLEAAVTAYKGLYDTSEPQEYQYNPKDFESLNDIPEDVDSFSPPEISDSAVGSSFDDNEAQRRQLARHQRQKRGRGLSFPAQEVVDKFSKVAVSTEKVRAKEQVTFDEAFFHHSFIYPDFSGEEESLQQFIAEDLIEGSMKKSLERVGRLNWWTRTGILPSLEPLATSGDGNCLLHAASLYMWGLHDRELILRTALHRTLTTGRERLGLRRRWKYNTRQKHAQIGLEFSDEEWEFEWQDMVRIATNQPRQQPTTASLKRRSSLKLSYESLEEIHVFALANVLKRAIIVISDRTIKNFSGEDLAPIYFGGIYLPFEINPTACNKSPIVLGYDSSHFAPLVAKEDKKMEEQRHRGKFERVSGRKDTVVPLVTPDGSLLPVQFVYDPEKKLVREKYANSEFTPGQFPDEITRLLESYLDIRWIQLKVESVQTAVKRSRSLEQADAEETGNQLPIEIPKIRFPAAHIKQKDQPIYQKELIEKYLDNVKARYEEQRNMKTKRENERRQREENQPVPCATEGCELFGKKITNNLCSMCFKATQLHQANREDQDSDDKEFFDPKTRTGENLGHASGYQWPVSEESPATRPALKQIGPSLSKQTDPPVTKEPAVKQAVKQPSVHPTTKKPPVAVVTKNGVPSPQPSPSKVNKLKQPEHTKSATPAPPKVATEPKSGSSKVPRKLKIIPSSPKKPKVTKGYSRDNIQPISLGATGGARIVCKTTGCDFFGAEERNGFCSKCFSE